MVVSDVEDKYQTSLLMYFRRNTDRRRVIIIILVLLFFVGIWYVNNFSTISDPKPLVEADLRDVMSKLKLQRNGQNTSKTKQRTTQIDGYNHKIDIEKSWFTSTCLKVEDKDELNIENIFTIIKSLRQSNEPICKNVYNIVQSIYRLQSSTSTVVINSIFAKKVLKWFNGNKDLLRQANHQKVMFVSNRYTQESTVFNPLRGKRPGAGGGGGPEARKLVDKMINESQINCDFCNYKWMTAKDPFGSIESKYSVSVANTFKLEKFHGLILWKHHNAMQYNEEQFLDAMNLAQQWFQKANEADKDHIYPHIYWDVLGKASASQIHPHFHVALAKGQYYAQWARLHVAAIDYANAHNGANYFTHLAKIHSLLGLAVHLGDATAMAYLTPKASHEVMFISRRPGKDIYRLLFYVMRSFIDDMGLYATSCGMVFPRLIDKPESGDLPMIVRLVFRGSVTSNRADISSIELFGTPNVNVDPYNVIRSIRGTMMKYGVLE